MIFYSRKNDFSRVQLLWSVVFVLGQVLLPVQTHPFLAAFDRLAISRGAAVFCELVQPGSSAANPEVLPGLTMSDLLNLPVRALREKVLTLGLDQDRVSFLRRRYKSR